MKRAEIRHPRKRTSVRPTHFTFICTACGTVEHRKNPALPDGWAIEVINHDVFAYCSNDAIDLPSGRCVQ